MCNTTDQIIIKFLIFFFVVIFVVVIIFIIFVFVFLKFISIKFLIVGDHCFVTLFVTIIFVIIILAILIQSIWQYSDQCGIDFSGRLTVISLCTAIRLRIHGYRDGCLRRSPGWNE